MQYQYKPVIQSLTHQTMTEFNQNSLCIGNLIRIAGSNDNLDAVTVLRSYREGDDRHDNVSHLTKNHKVPALENCASFLKLEIRDQDDKKLYNKDNLADRIVLAIMSYFPTICSTCDSEYKIDFEGAEPTVTCYLCHQGAHPSCSSRPIGPAGTVWICTTCLDTHKPLYPLISIPIEPISAHLVNEGTQTVDSPPNLTDQGTETEDLHQPTQVAIDAIPENSTPPVFNSSSILNTPSLATTQIYIPDSPVTSYTQSFRPETHNESIISNPSHEVQTTYSIERSICQLYKIGKCPHGLSGKTMVNNQQCKFAHPKKCRYYCRHGPNSPLGCRKGGSCTFFHPVLCKYSVQKHECTNLECTFTHLKFTKRYTAHPERENISPPNYQKSPDSNRRLDPNVPDVHQSQRYQSHDAPNFTQQLPVPQSHQNNDMSFLVKLVEHVKDELLGKITTMEKDMRSQIDSIIPNSTNYLSPPPQLFYNPPLQNLTMPQINIPQNPGFQC